MSPSTLSEPLPRSESERLLDRAREPHAIPRGARTAAAASLLVGIGVVALGLILLPGPTWHALLVGFLFWTGVAQAGPVIAAMFLLTGARWGRVVQRMAAGMGAFLPFSLPVLLSLWFGREYLFPWLGEPDRHAWFSVGWLFLRDSLMLVVLAAVSLALLYFSVRPDLPGERQGRDRLAAWMTRGWRGREDERERSRRLERPLAAGVLVGFFLGLSLLSIDLSMSLAPRFHSTMFPVIYLAGSFLAALGMTGVVLNLWLRTDHVRRIVVPRHLLDLGNLMWAASLFLAYVWWAQYLIIWMGNLPYEAEHHLVRWYVWPWNALAWTALAFAFLVPAAALFSQRLKTDARNLGWIGGIAAFGVLLQRFLEVLPALEPDPQAIAVPVYLGANAAFLGGAALVYFWLMERVPLFPVADELFLEELQVRRIEV